MVVKTESEIRQEVYNEITSELFDLSKKYKNNDKREGVQDAYTHVVGLRNSDKKSK